jgi:hypothetical protein
MSRERRQDCLCASEDTANKEDRVISWRGRRQPGGSTPWSSDRTLEGARADIHVSGLGAEGDGDVDHRVPGITWLVLALLANAGPQVDEVQGLAVLEGGRLRVAGAIREPEPVRLSECGRSSWYRYHRSPMAVGLHTRAHRGRSAIVASLLSN